MSKNTVFVALGALVVGLIFGFVLGVASVKRGRDFLADLAQSEQDANIAHSQKIDRPAFKLEFPGNWKLDVEDKDYDPDQRFSIDSPGTAFVMFNLMPAKTDPASALETQVSTFSSKMGLSVAERFQRYGQLEGNGAVLKGKLLGVAMTVRVFSYSQDKLTVLVAEQGPDEDRPQADKGFALVENSFALKSVGDAREK